MLKKPLNYAVDVILACKDTVHTKAFQVAYHEFNKEKERLKRQYDEYQEQIKCLERQHDVESLKNWRNLHQAAVKELTHRFNARRLRRVGVSIAVKDGIIESVFD